MGLKDTGSIDFGTPDQRLHDDKEILKRMFHSGEPGQYYNHWKDLINTIAGDENRSNYYFGDEIKHVLRVVFGCGPHPSNQTSGCSCAEIKEMLREQTKTLECKIRDLGKKQQTNQTDGCSCAKISEMLEAQRQNINSETRATIKKEIRHIGTNEHTQEIIQELKTLQNKSQELLDHQIDNTAKIIQEIRNGRNSKEILDKLEKMKRDCEENKKQILEEIKNQSSPLEYQLCNINNKMNQLATKDDVRNIQIPDDIARKQDLPKIPANLATKEDVANIKFPRYQPF
ncbi:hypothetical protein V6N12_021385 [Hibiscus sabdariffa]|uniref:Uncharacterized protein n=1 Tax=Hibiscus sabdariffa TaxID=183260 RepID=A0ABR2FRP5_9ROSI